MKNDKDIEDFYFLCFMLAKVCVSRWGERQTGRKIYFLSLFIKLRKRHRDIKGHSNNKDIIIFIGHTHYCITNLGKW